MPIRLALLFATLLLTSLVPLLCACGDRGSASESSPQWSHTVTQLDEVPVDPQTVVVVWLGPKNVHWVYKETRKEGVRLVIDGKPGATYPAFPVTWGQEGTCIEMEGPSFFIGPRGRTFAHPAEVEGGVSMVIDGVVGPRFDRLWPVRFSADGKHAAYVALDGDQHVVMLDGKEHARVAGVGAFANGGWPTFIFSSDGGRFAFVETKRETGGPARERAWIDGVAKPWFAQVRWLRFSPDGQDVAYIAMDREPRQRQRLVRSDKIGPSFSSIGIPTFSPDSQHVAYYGRRRDGSGLILDNVPQTEGLTDIVGPVVFSPDSAHIAYVESVEGGWRVVLDGKAQATYERVSGLRFRPDGEDVRYMTQQGARWRMVSGDGAGPDATALWRVQHSADGTRSAYRLMSADKQTSMVIDGVVTPVNAAWASDPVFSPSGHAIAYDAHGDGQARMLLNGEAGPVFERILASFGEAWVHGRFDDDDTYRYLALREGHYHLIVAKRKK